MVRAVEALALRVDAVLVDGNRGPRFACPSQPVVMGDGTEPSPLSKANEKEEATS